MTVWKSEVRHIQYYRSFFVSAIEFNHDFACGDEPFPEDGFETMVIHWSHSPFDAKPLTDEQAAWLIDREYGVTVTLRITLDGMPDEEEPD